MTVPTPNQSYYVKEMEYVIAACVTAMMHDKGGRNRWDAGVWKNPNLTVWAPTSWRVNSQHFHLKPVHKGDDAGYVNFSSARWDPQHSDIAYGEKRIEQNVLATDDAKTKVIRNDTDGQIHVSYEESEELTNSFSSSVTKGLTLDVSVDSEQKISGSYAGVSAEVSLSEHFGVSKSTEETKEQAEEGTKAETIAIEFDAEPRSSYLVTVTKEHERTQEPFDINGVMDFDIEMGIVDNDGKTHKISVKGIDGLLQLVYGYDTNYPRFAGYWDKAYSRVKNGINYIANPSHRRIQVSGISYATLENNADYRVELLGATVPDRFSALPQVSAQDVSA